MFHRCELTASNEVTKVYLGRPRRPFAHTLFVHCFMDKHIAFDGG
ncbi:hypothetical protein HXA35_16085 [Bacillus sp. A301a_S52]|nr:hypothetical protein [Bacillus sp. A301a_S52]